MTLGVEFDCRMSKDGVLVVMHDVTLDRSPPPPPLLFPRSPSEPEVTATPFHPDNNPLSPCRTTNYLDFVGTDGFPNSGDVGAWTVGWTISIRSGMDNDDREWGGNGYKRLLGRAWLRMEMDRKRNQNKIIQTQQTTTRTP